MAVDLIFLEGHYAGGSLAVPLVFGELDPPPGDSRGSGTVVLELLVDGVGVTGDSGVGLILMDDAPIVDGTGDYDNAVSRGPRVSVSSPWQNAAAARGETAVGWTGSTPARAQVAMPIVDAAPLQAEVTTGWATATSTRQQRAATWQEAVARRTQALSPFQEGAPARQGRSLRFEEARRASGDVLHVPYQETIRTSRPTIRFKHEEAKHAEQTFRSVSHDALGLVRSWTVPWEEARHAPPGRSVIVPITPPVDLCYTPPAGGDVPLVFNERWSAGTDLVFFCDNHPPPPSGTVVVPIQGVYMVSNEVSLVLASDGTVIPTRSFTLSLDYRSWSWSFTARVPRAALAIFDMDAGGDAKVLTATVNGTSFGILAETVASDRQFGTGDVTINGRGLIAALDAPYAPTLTFANATDMTAQQVVADVLTFNGVSLGWEIDWQITDWLVPAGAWSGQGTYMTALQNIAAAVGAYVQPTANDQTVRILPLFPAAPWDWSTLTPDFEIPSAVATREGITWSDMPVYNRIFVSGANVSGILGQVTRTGTAGDVVKIMVADALITHADAARQRGIAELSTGGRSALVSLKMPVLEATGVITPGKLLKYTDGDVERLGIVRSVQVDVSFPTVYQTIGVETYV